METFIAFVGLLNLVAVLLFGALAVYALMKGNGKAKKNGKYAAYFFFVFVFALVLTPTDSTTTSEIDSSKSEEVQVEEEKKSETDKPKSESTPVDTVAEKEKVDKEEERKTKEEAERKAKVEKEAKEKAEKEAEEKKKEEAKKKDSSKNERFEGYKLIEVDGGNLSGHREPNVAVDIGFGDREYWAFTNEHGQLVRVVADEIIVQDDNTEPVKSNGRYYYDEAKVPGVESDHLDEGHVIADSLGGVSNAYNITPQESTLNRHGDQAYMEEVIRKAGGATNFEAIITYPNTDTQIPSSYQYTYTINGNKVVDSFDNVNPDKVNESLGLTKSEPAQSSNSSSSSNESSSSNSSSGTSSSKEGDLSSVDTNGNGRVTIQEAKDAGYKMPITSDHWLYQYMDDRDGDGMVGE